MADSTRDLRGLLLKLLNNDSKRRTGGIRNGARAVTISLLSAAD